MQKMLKALMTALLVGLLVSPEWVYSAASGNYTDLLPVGAAGNTTVISNGSGWSLTTLAPSQTFGDALSRAPMTVYEASNTAILANSSAVSTFTALSTQGFVGSTTFPPNWVAAGRSFRISLRGNYSTSGAPNWTWGIQLGTTTLVTTGAKAAPQNASIAPFSAIGLCTINAPGNTGTVACSYDIFATTSAASATISNFVSYSTAASNGIGVDLTTQLQVLPVFQWGTAATGNTITITNSIIEFLN